MRGERDLVRVSLEFLSPSSLLIRSPELGRAGALCSAHPNHHTTPHHQQTNRQTDRRTQQASKQATNSSECSSC